MGKTLLLTVVFMSVALGMLAGRTRRLMPGLWQLLALFLAYDVLYIALLYYLRHKWLS
jgi:hypothetical protein